MDYPYDDMADAANWLDHAPISELDRVKPAHGNAGQLFHFLTLGNSRHGTTAPSRWMGRQTTNLKINLAELPADRIRMQSDVVRARKRRKAVE